MSFDRSRPGFALWGTPFYRPIPPMPSPPRVFPPAAYPQSLATTLYANAPLGTVVLVLDTNTLYISVPVGFGSVSGTGNDWSVLAVTSSAPTVPASGYTYTDQLSDASVFFATGNTSEEFYNVCEGSRIRQSGTIHSVSFFLFARPVVFTSCKLRIWRPSIASTGLGTMTLIGESDDLVAKIDAYLAAHSITNGVVHLPITPIPGVQAGDFPGVYYQGAVSATQPFGTRHPGAAENTTIYYVFAGAPIASGATIGSQAPGVAGWNMPIQVGMVPPTFVGSGDSIGVGSPTNDGFINPTATNLDVPQSWQGILAASRVWSHQNLALGGATMVVLAYRFARDVVGALPKYAMLEGGINDIVGNVSAVPSVIANYTTELAECLAAGVIPVVIGILPRTGNTTAEAQAVDAVNVWLRANLGAYNGIDATGAVTAAFGQFRPGGDPGNLWDMIPALTGDGTHPNLAGQTVFANAVSSVIP
jgi:lysophospholipase L1-like esterase